MDMSSAGVEMLCVQRHAGIKTVKTETGNNTEKQNIRRRQHENKIIGR
jgi:hypothetical protein